MGSGERRKTAIDPFPLTDWERVSALADASDHERDEILSFIARSYWTPLLIYVQRRGYSDGEAQDLVQDFFAFALRTRLFAKAEAERGKFRAYLLGSLKNFLANARRDGAAEKRRPSGGFVSADHSADTGYLTPRAMWDEMTPEAIFHSAWISELVRNSVERLRHEFLSRGKESHFALFQARVVGPELTGDEAPPLADQAAELGLGYKEAANQLVTAKRAFRRILQQEIRRYAHSDADAECDQLEAGKLLFGTDI